MRWNDRFIHEINEDFCLIAGKTLVWSIESKVLPPIIIVFSLFAVAEIKVHTTLFPSHISVGVYVPVYDARVWLFTVFICSWAQS